MKKLFCLILVTLFLFSSCCEERRTYIPDDGFEQDLINKGYDDILDNYVLTASIDTIKKYGISWFVDSETGDGGPIGGADFQPQNLIGIQDFKLLEELKIDANGLTWIDLTENAALTTFTMFDTSGIHSIDLSSNTNLTNVNINNNVVLSRINLANGNNVAIATLNLKPNPNLICIKVDDVAWSNTNWSTFKEIGAIFSTSCGFY